MLETTLESPLDCKEIQPVHPKGNQSWIFIVKIDAEVEAPIFWLPDMKKWLIGKDPDAGKDWRGEEKETTEDEMVGWPHWLDGHEIEQAPGVGDEQGSLACCSPWGLKESETTEQLNWLTDWTFTLNFIEFGNPLKLYTELMCQCIFQLLSYSQGWFLWSQNAYVLKSPYFVSLVHCMF